MTAAIAAPFGRVYRWELPPARDATTTAPHAVSQVVRLPNLIDRAARSRGLRGRFVSVQNGAVINVPALTPDGPPRVMPLGDAEPDEQGNLIFDPGRGGGRIDKVEVAEPGVRSRYLQAARFGEVNTYFHLDAIASYVDDLLGELGAPSLPPVIAVVHAHGAPAGTGPRDGRLCPDGRWVPFQGGHYRLPGRATRIREHGLLSPMGEIHLGPGQKLARGGALAQLVGGPYRANASHNPGIILHEYGHHISRHTADFRANWLRPPGQQSNRKTGIDEGCADYWTAVMLGTPHIWFFHHPTDPAAPHRRSLTSTRTLADTRRADPHAVGTVWAAALWDLRVEAIQRAGTPDTGRRIDRLLLQALLLIGEQAKPKPNSGATGVDADRAAGERVRACVRQRRSFRSAASALLEADAILYHGVYRDRIARVLTRRGIDAGGSCEIAAAPSANGLARLVS